MDVRFDKVSFRGSSGELLDARLDLPRGAPVAFALVAHCFVCSKDLVGLKRLTRALTHHGWAVLRFDFTGLGSSEGEFANTNFTSNVSDLVAAADHLRQAFQAPALLFGQSLGGAAVLRAAEKIPEVRAVGTLNAPFDLSLVPKLLGPAAEKAVREGEAEITIAGRPFRIRRDFVEDLEGQRMEDSIRNLRCPLMVFHSTADEYVGLENGERIFGCARSPKSFVSIDGGDHLLTRDKDAVFVASVLAPWASRYAHPVAGPMVEPLPSARPVEVSEAGEGPFAQDIQVGPHSLRADEPESFGGRDTGPSPYDLLSAALGACTAMTIRMYASRNGWPLEHVTVQLLHRKVHAKDCVDCETTMGHVDEVERRIRLEGPLDEAQRARLLEIADRCPVHRSLDSEVKVRTTLVESG